MKRTYLIGILLLIIGVAGVIFTFSGSFGSSGSLKLNLTTIDESVQLPASGITRMKVDVQSADIRFEQAAGDTVEVSLEGSGAKRYAERTKLQAEASGDTINVGIEAPRFQFGINFNDLTLRIAVPEKDWRTLELRTGSGDIVLADLRAERIELATGSGDMQLTSLAGEQLSIKTGSGDVNVAGYGGDAVEVSVGSGDVQFVDVAAAANVKTGSGDVEYEAAAITADTSIRTGSGNIELALDEAPQSLDVDLDTSSGRASVEFDEFTRKEGQDSRGRVTGSFGDGGVKLQARAGSGNIEIGQR